MDVVDPFKIPMLAAQSVDETVSDPVPLNNTRQHSHFVQFEAAATTGVVEVEQAPTRDYTGAWEVLETFNLATMLAATNPSRVASTSLPGLGGFVRHRISTVVAGGGSPSVTSWCERIMVGGNRVSY